MAGSIKGIIVEIGGDTSGLQKALSKVNSATASLSKELRGINSLLKLDPKNTELLAQKQTVLNQQITTTEEELEQLNKIKQEADKKMSEGTEINEENYRKLQREIINTQNKLSDLKNEASNWNKAGEKLTQWGENLDKISKKIDNLGNKLTTRLTAPIVAVATAGITYDAQIEKYETAFKTFLGSAEKAGKAIKNIKDDAKRTPFDTTSLVKANQMLISTGVSADDAREDILALGEAVVATGGGNDELVRMSSNLQQIKNAGKATAMDIRQFAYAGIDVYGILADYTGKTTKEVKDMEISYEDLTKALKKASSNGGKYFGAMSNASETLTGQVSALKSEVQDGVGELTKSLMPVAKKVVSKARELIKEFDNLSDAQKENIVKIGLMVAAAGPLLKIGSAAISTIGSVSKGLGTFTKAIGLAKNGIGTATGSAATLAKALQILCSPVGLATVGIAGLATTAIYFATKETDAQKATREFAEEMQKSKTSIDEYNAKINESTNANLSHINSAEQLKNELTKLVDENGKVKKGYESRVSFILNELNEALGTEYKLNGNLIEGYKELQGEIDTLIKKKRAEIILSSEEEKYKNAIENEEQALSNLKIAYENLQKTQSQYGMTYDELKQKVQDFEKSIEDGTNTATLSEIKEIKSIKNVLEAYDNSNQLFKQGQEDKKQYANDYALFLEEKYDEIGTTITTKTQDLNNTSLESLKNMIKETSADLETYKKMYKDNGEEITKTKVEQAQKDLENLAEELNSRTSTIEQLTPEEVEAWKTLSTSSYETYKKILEKMSPEMRTKINEITGVVDKDTEVNRATQGLAEKAEKGFNDNVDGNKWGSDLSKEISTSLSNKESKNRISNAAHKVADWISSFLHFSLPDKGPLADMDKSMPDMLDLMKKGIDRNKPILVDSVQNLAKDINKALNVQSSINSKIIDQTRTVFTTPNIIINAQDELTPAKMNSIINTVNRRLGSRY